MSNNGANGNTVRLPSWVIVWATTLLVLTVTAWVAQDRRLTRIEGRLENVEAALMGPHKGSK